MTTQRDLRGWLWLALYPFAWLRVRLPDWPRIRFRAWNTAMFVADAKRRDRRFREEYGDIQGYLDTLLVADDDTR